MANPLFHGGTEKVLKLEELALQVITGVKNIENSRAVFYRRVAPTNLDFIRIHRLVPVRQGNVIEMVFELLPPPSCRYASISLSEDGETMIILYGHTKDYKPQPHRAGIGYGPHEMEAAHRDVYKYLAKGYIPTATEG